MAQHPPQPPPKHHRTSTTPPQRWWMTSTKRRDSMPWRGRLSVCAIFLLHPASVLLSKILCRYPSSSSYCVASLVWRLFFETDIDFTYIRCSTPQLCSGRIVWNKLQLVAVCGKQLLLWSGSCSWRMSMLSLIKRAFDCEFDVFAWLYQESTRFRCPSRLESSNTIKAIVFCLRNVNSSVNCNNYILS